MNVKEGMIYDMYSNVRLQLYEQNHELDLDNVLCLISKDRAFKYDSRSSFVAEPSGICMTMLHWFPVHHLAFFFSCITILEAILAIKCLHQKLSQDWVLIAWIMCLQQNEW